MRTWSRGMIAAALLLLVAGATTSLRAQAPQWNVGDVFAAIGSGQYNVYSNAGVLKQTITDGAGPDCPGARGK